MLDKLAVLSGYDYFYAAVLAFLITYLIMRVRNFRNNVLKKDELEMDIKNADRKSIMDRCSKMFRWKCVQKGHDCKNNNNAAEGIPG